MPQKLPKLDFTTDAEYVANLINVNVVCKRATVQFITRVFYTCITTFFLQIS